MRWCGYARIRSRRTQPRDRRKGATSMSTPDSLPSSVGSFGFEARSAAGPSPTTTGVTQKRVPDGSNCAEPSGSAPVVSSEPDVRVHGPGRHGHDRSGPCQGGTQRWGGIEARGTRRSGATTWGRLGIPPQVAKVYSPATPTRGLRPCQVCGGGVRGNDGEVVGSVARRHLVSARLAGGL